MSWYTVRESKRHVESLAAIVSRKTSFLTTSFVGAFCNDFVFCTQFSPRVIKHAATPVDPCEWPIKWMSAKRFKAGTHEGACSRSTLLQLPWSQRFFLSREEIHEAVKTSPEEARREKPLVTLDLNLTFKQSPGSGSNPQARIGWYFLQTRKSILLVRLTGNAKGTRDC